MPLDASWSSSSEQQPNDLVVLLSAAHVFCRQNACLQLPTSEVRPLLKILQKNLHIEDCNAELALDESLASHADPKYNDWKMVVFQNTAWQLNSTDTGYLDAQCTGLGGGELDNDWDVLLACREAAHVYGPSLSKMIGMQDVARLRALHTPRSTSSYTLPCSQSQYMPNPMFSEYPLLTNCKHKSSIGRDHTAKQQH